TEDDTVLHLHMAGQHDIVGHDDVVAEDAVVGDMGIGEEKTVAPHHRRAAAIHRAGIHGHAFAHGAVLTDRKRGLLTGMMHALGIAADHRHREDPAALADFGPAGHHGIRMDLDAVFQHHFRTDPRE